jgi:hypothetical protein
MERVSYRERIKQMAQFLIDVRLHRAAELGEDISQADQAAWLSEGGENIPPTTYGPWEKARRMPDPKFWPQLSAKLGPGFDKIVGLPVDPLVQYINSVARRASEEERKELLQFARDLEAKQSGDRSDPQLDFAT